MGSANWGAFRGSPNHAANWMAPCFSVPSSEAGGHTQYQPKSGIFKSAVLDHFHIGADSCKKEYWKTSGWYTFNSCQTASGTRISPNNDCRSDNFPTIINAEMGDVSLTTITFVPAPAPDPVPNLPDCNVREFVAILDIFGN